MKFKKFVEIEKPTKEMISFYNKRTKDHIKRVKKNCYHISEERDDLNKIKLVNRGIEHDKSKFSINEYIPYIWLTWYFKEKNEGRKFEYPNIKIKKEINKAVIHHYNKNRHHPEYYNDLNNMEEIDIAEMIADWAAMSQEFNNSLKQYGNKVIGKKYKFNKNQKRLIYELMEELFEK